MTENKPPVIAFPLALILGFSLFGLLIGYITGLTDSEIAKTIITGLFAFIGGKLLNDFNKKQLSNAREIGLMLIGFSFLFFIGLNGGIAVKVNKLLTFHHAPKSKSARDSTSAENIDHYLRNGVIWDSATADSLLRKLANGEVSGRTKDSLLRLFLTAKPK